MLVKIKQKHFRLAIAYHSFHCPLNYALKDVFKHEKIIVGGIFVDVADKSYRIDRKWGEEISVEEINQNIKLAKQKKKVKSYVVELS